MQSGRSRDNIEKLSSQSDSDDNLWSHEVSFRNGRLEDSKRQDLKAEVLEDEEVFEPETSLLEEELKKRLSLEKRLAEIEARLANIETVSTEGKADDSDVTSDSTEDNNTTSGKRYSGVCLESATRNNCEETLFPISGASSKNVEEPLDYLEDSGSLVKECRSVTTVALIQTENPLIHSTIETSVSQLPIDYLDKLSCSGIQSSELIDTSHKQTFDRHHDAEWDLVCERGFDHGFDHVATASDGSDWAYSVTLDSPSVLAGSETLDTSNKDTIVGDLSNKPKPEIHAFYFRENDDDVKVIGSTTNNDNITEDTSDKDTCESDSIEEDISNAGESEINNKVSGDEYEDSLDHSESISDKDGGTSSNSDKDLLQEFNEEGGVEELHNLDRNCEFDPVHEELNAQNDLPHPDPDCDDNDSLDLSSHDAGSDVLKTTTDLEEPHVHKEDCDCLIKELEREAAHQEKLQTERDIETLKASEGSLLDTADVVIPDNHISPPEESNKDDDKNESFDLPDHETEIDKEEEEEPQTAETESDYPEKVDLVTSDEDLINLGQDNLDCHSNTTEALEVTQADEKDIFSERESNFQPVEDSFSIEKDKPESEIHSEKLVEPWSNKVEQTSEAALSDENCNTPCDSVNVEIIDCENIVTIESGSLKEEPELKESEDISKSGNPQILLADALATISADQDSTSNSKVGATLNNQITHESVTDLDDVGNSAEDALFEVVEQICDQTYDQNFEATPVDEIPKSADEITILPVIPEFDCDLENNEADLFVVHYTENSRSAPSDQKEKRSKTPSKKLIPKLNKAAVARLSKGKEEEEKKIEKKKAGTGVTLSQTFKKQKAAKNKKKSQSDLLAVDDNNLAETIEGEIDVDIVATKKINKPFRPVGRPPESKKQTETALTKDAKSAASLETSTDYLPKEKKDSKAKQQLKRASSLDKKKIKTIEYKEEKNPDFQEVKETNKGDNKECSSPANNPDDKNRSGTQQNSDLIGESNAKAEYSETKSTDTSDVIVKSDLKVVKSEQKTHALNNKIELERSDNHRRSRSQKKKPKRSRSLDRSFDKDVKLPRSRSRENPLSKQEKHSVARQKKLSVPLKYQAHYIARYFANNSVSVGLKNDPGKKSLKKEEQENKMADTALTPVEEDILQAQAKAISKMIENGTLDDVEAIPKPDAEVKEAELASVCSAAASFDSLDLLEAERAPWEIKGAGAGARNVTDNIVGVISHDAETPEVMLSVQDNGKKSSTEDGSLAPPNHVSKIPSRTIIPKPNFKSKLPSSSSRLNAPSQKPEHKSPNYSRSNSSDGDDGSAKGLAMVINGAVTPERKLSQPCDSLTSSRAPKLSSKPRSLTVDSGDFNCASLNKNSDNVSIISSAPLLPRETSASRKRMEKIHIQTMKAMEPVTDEYLTPMQRKENLLKDMKQEIKGLQKSNEEKEFEIANFMCKMNNKIDDITREKDYKITHLEGSLLETQKNYEKMADAYKDSLTIIGELEKTVTDMKDEMDQREKNHQEMYLEMYNKGQETAKFERQDEIEKIGKDDPDSVTTVEVLEKLKTKEIELEHWMSLKRKEMYEETELPDTEAAATLRFMKDSMFHYLTNPKEMEREVHLRAMINIFKYSTVQTRSVDKALREKKKKGKT